MKNKGSFFVTVLAVLLIAVLGFAGCNDEQVITKYTVSFETNGGSAVEAITVAEGVGISLPVTAKDGYIFDGWYDNASFFGDALAATYTPTGNIKLYAKWKESGTVPSTDVKVVFMVNGKVYAEKISKDGKVDLPDAPSLNDKVFDAWYLNADCTILFDENRVSTKDPHSPLNVYANFVDASAALLRYANGDDGTLNVTGVTDKSVTELTVPVFYNGKKVSGIAKGVFSDCTSLQSLSLPFVGLTPNTESKTQFADLFDGNENIPASLTTVTVTSPEVSNYAFAGCDKLTTIKLSGVTYIGDRAFYGCKSLSDLDIPEGVAHIGEYAFWNCAALESLNVPKSMTRIGDRAFWGFVGAKNISLPETLTAIGYQSFYQCSRLTNITIPNGVVSIGSQAYIKCARLNSVTVPGSVKKFGSNIFDSCTALKTVTFADGITSIGKQMFNKCAALENVTIPDSVVDIAADAFAGCEQLVYEETGNCLYLSNWLMKAKNTEVTQITPKRNTVGIFAKAFDSCENLTSVSFSAGLKTVGASAFHYCKALKSVSLPEGLLNIGDSAFKWCNDPLLTEFNIPDSVKNIGQGAFSECMYLNKIVLPSGLTSIPNKLFYGCSKMTTVVLPKGIKSIGTSAFQACPSLKQINLDYGLVSIGDKAFYNTALTSVSLPDSVTSVGEEAFSYGRSLTKFSASAHMTTLAKSIFWNCGVLSEVTLPDSLYSIGNLAFWNCTSLKSISIPANVVKIEVNAFLNCPALTDIYCEAPSEPVGWVENWDGECGATIHWASGNVTTDANYDYVIKNGEVYLTRYKGAGGNVSIPASIDGKKVVSFGGIFAGNTDITSIIFPDSTTYIVPHAFLNCTGLKSIIIPDTVKTIGFAAFEGCSSVERVSLPWVVSYIGYIFGANAGSNNVVNMPVSLVSINVTNASVIESYAFYGCANLSDITLPHGVTDIGARTFMGCIGLTDFVVPDSVKSLGLEAFKDCTSLVNVTFADTTGWYVTKTEGSETGISVPVTDSAANAVKLNGTDSNYYWYRTGQY